MDLIDDLRGGDETEALTQVNGYAVVAYDLGDGRIVPILVQHGLVWRESFANVPLEASCVRAVLATYGELEAEVAERRFVADYPPQPDPITRAAGLIDPEGRFYTFRVKANTWNHYLLAQLLSLTRYGVYLGDDELTRRGWIKVHWDGSLICGTPANPAQTATIHALAVTSDEWATQMLDRLDRGWSPAGVNPAA